MSFYKLIKNERNIKKTLEKIIKMKQKKQNKKRNPKSYILLLLLLMHKNYKQFFD